MMKTKIQRSVFLLSMILTYLSYGQSIDYNLQSGKGAEGYDLIEYFNNKAVEGNSKISYSYEGVTYNFSSSKNLESFRSDPDRYLPQYGGWCAYAMGAKADKVSINPETFEIRDGKLYLFYDAFFNNTLKSWKSEGPEKLRAQADKNWEKLKFKK